MIHHVQLTCPAGSETVSVAFDPHGNRLEFLQPVV
jgi:hypothetical protein